MNRMSPRLLGAAIAALLASEHTIAQVPTGFSRACQFSRLASISQSAYFSASGQLLSTGIPVVDAHPDTKDRLWANESITADYGMFRYWLLAYAGQYKDGYKHTIYQSPWNSTSLYDNNRQLLTSVRAGHDLSAPNGTTPGLFELKPDGSYQVIGVHYVFDPLSGQMLYLGTSRAINCNCTQWGFAYEPLNWIVAVPVCIG